MEMLRRTLALATLALSATALSAGGISSLFFEDSPYDSVMDRLDKRGTTLFYADGRESFQKYAKSLDDIGNVVSQMGMVQRAPAVEQESMKRTFRILAAAYRASGLAEVDAYGFSTIRREDGLFDTKAVLRCPADKNSGFIWNAFGAQPHDLESIVGIMPPSTSSQCFQISM